MKKNGWKIPIPPCYGIFSVKLTPYVRSSILKSKGLSLGSIVVGDFSPLKSNHTLELARIFRPGLTSIGCSHLSKLRWIQSYSCFGGCNPLFNVCVHAHWTPNIPFWLLRDSFFFAVARHYDLSFNRSSDETRQKSSSGSRDMTGSSNNCHNQSLNSSIIEGHSLHCWSVAGNENA